MSPDEVIRAVTAGNVIMPVGQRQHRRRDAHHADELGRRATSTICSSCRSAPAPGPPVFLRDVGSVSDSTDIPTGYALVNGRRAVYIPVTKRADASTLRVVSEVKATLPRFQALVPDDIKVSATSSTSRATSSSALQAVAARGAARRAADRPDGAAVPARLAQRRRSSSSRFRSRCCAAVVALWAAGQTINIMTLGGLALAVGILVDEATVAIENIHTHLARGAPVARGRARRQRRSRRARASWRCCAVVAVFVPSFFMTGVARSLFVPLSLAVGFAMIASFLLSSTLVPVLSVWLLAPAPAWRTPRRIADGLGRASARAAGARCCSGWRRRAAARGGLCAS